MVNKMQRNNADGGWLDLGMRFSHFTQTHMEKKTEHKRCYCPMTSTGHLLCWLARLAHAWLMGMNFSYIYIYIHGYAWPGSYLLCPRDVETEPSWHLKDVSPVSSVYHVLSKGVEHHWLSVSIMEVISERQWPLAFSHSESCSSCGCHTKWPPPGCLLRLLTPGYSTGVSPFHYHFCHLWRGRSMSERNGTATVYAEQKNLTIAHKHTHS